MSIVVKNNKKESKPPVRLGVKDSDFLLKLIARSQFEGSEVEQAYVTIQKLGKIHRGNIED